jgi:hypothetical protein
MEPETRREIARHRQEELARLARGELLLGDGGRRARRRWTKVFSWRRPVAPSNPAVPAASPRIEGSR